jgi:hypothetical protein
MCISRQWTGKHLATEYTHATIELRILLLVARQQSAPIKSLTRNYVTGFLWVRSVTTATQRLDKQTLNNEATVFRGVRTEGLSWRQLERPRQLAVDSLQVNTRRSEQNGHIRVYWLEIV